VRRWILMILDYILLPILSSLLLHFGFFLHFFQKGIFVKTVIGVFSQRQRHRNQSIKYTYECKWYGHITQNKKKRALNSRVSIPTPRLGKVLKQVVFKKSGARNNKNWNGHSSKIVWKKCYW
jgi:hypothetical protein